MQCSVQMARQTFFKRKNSGKRERPNDDESMPPPEASSPFTQTSEQAQQNRSLPPVHPRAQRAIVYCFTNQVNPNVAGNRLLFCHATMPFVRARFRCKSSSLPSDIFGGANSREPIAAVEIGVGQSAVSFLKVQFSPTF